MASHGASLRIVDVSHATRLTDAALDALIAHVPNLEYIGLRGLTRLTLDGLRRLTAAFPNLDAPTGQGCGNHIRPAAAGHWRLQ